MNLGEKMMSIELKEQPLIHLTQVQEGPNPCATWA